MCDLVVSAFGDRHCTIRLPAGRPCARETRATAYDDRGDYTRSHDVGTLAVVPARPQPVVIVAWLVPPAAASVAAPLRDPPRSATISS
jgi:hypothetical protein